MTNPTTRYGHIEPEHQGKVLNVKQAAPGEVEHHGGSFRKYMENKNKKLQEQFDQQSAVAAAYGTASGHAVSTLFTGVSITVNGFTTPSQQDLKQIMALHGGNFEVYYRRSYVTHIICSNLTDAKVKIFQRERDPTPVVRPEWVVDSLKAGVLLPLEEYVLWRLRDVPGQRTLSAFRQQPGTAALTTQKPAHIAAALPPSPYKQYAASAADTSLKGQPAALSSTAQQSAFDADFKLHHEAPLAAGNMQSGVAAQHQAFDAAQQTAADKHGPVKALSFGAAAEDTDLRPKASNAPAAEPDLLAESHPSAVLPTDGHSPQSAATGSQPHAEAALLHAVDTAPGHGHNSTGPARQEGLACAATASRHAPADIRKTSDSTNEGHIISSTESARQEGLASLADASRHAPADIRKTSDSTIVGHTISSTKPAQQEGLACVADASRHASADSRKTLDGVQVDAAEYRIAHERAAAARAACDLLRGPPKSSRDDPHFMDSYYKSSRLSFIGRWKARIEALTASMAAHAPLPQTAHQPSALLTALKGDKGAEAQTERAIIHLDMDCFFASVAELADSAFKGKPLAVSHSNSAQGTGEISSANYEARKFGIKASMFIAEAKKRCPHLIVMPYQFDKYEEVSEQVYKILLQATACVQPVSCDEAYLDVTGLGDPSEVATSIRQQIFEATGCTASAGIGPCMLVARLATKKGKPNGQFRIQSDQVDAYLLDLGVDELPGVGWNMCHKLKDIGISSVRQVRATTKEALQRELGNKTGGQVWAYAHGVDERQVEPPKSRKSVGAECNWGIRFQNDADAVAFMDNLAGELSTRMKAAGVKGRTVSLKIKRRKTNAPDPPKFMGHGDCDNMSRSVTLSRFTDASSELASQGKALLRALKIDPTQIRGIGLNMTRLDTDPASAAAKPGGTAPSKVSAPPPSTHDPRSGPWVRFWQDKPQHWGVPSGVKSTTELADANASRPASLQTSDRPSSAGAGQSNPEAGKNTAQAAQNSSPVAERSASDAHNLQQATEEAQQRGAVDNAAHQQPPAELLSAADGEKRDQLAEQRSDQPAKSGSLEHASSPSATAAASLPVSNDDAGSRVAEVQAVLPAAEPAASASVLRSVAKRAAFNMYSPTKGTLQVLQKPPVKGPSPRKQAGLEDMLTKQAAAAEAQAALKHKQAQERKLALAAQRTETDDHVSLVNDLVAQKTDADGRVSRGNKHVTVDGSHALGLPRVVLPHAGLISPQQQLPGSLQGLTLSQIDATVFAALPPEHQQELLQNLPKNSEKPKLPAPTAAVASNSASDFAFMTKLANLQKAGLGKPTHTAAHSDSAETSDSGHTEAAGITHTAADSKAAGSDTTANAEKGAREPVQLHSKALANQPISAMPTHHASTGAGSIEKKGSKSLVQVHATKPTNTQHNAPAHDSPANLAGPQVLRDSVSEGQDTNLDAPEHQSAPSLAAVIVSAQQAQQAQHTPEIQAESINAGHANVQPEQFDPQGSLDLDQPLDLDLMDEERTALASFHSSSRTNHAQHTQHAKRELPRAVQSTEGAAPAASDGSRSPAPQLQLQHSSSHDQSDATTSRKPKHEIQPNHTSITADAAGTLGPNQQLQQSGRQGRAIFQAAVTAGPAAVATAQAAVAAGQAAVAALPPASQIDASVLNALPLEVRRELELAYGLVPTRRSPSKPVKRRREGLLPAAPARAIPNKKQRVLDRLQAISRQAQRLAAHSRMTEAALSFTQVDPSVLCELPQDLQDELSALLPARSKHAKQAQPQRTAADLQHPAAARLNLLKVGRGMNNHAIRAEQQQLAAAAIAAEQALDNSMRSASVEPASELWPELEIALNRLSNNLDSCNHVGNKSSSDKSEKRNADVAQVEEKLDALKKLVVQWAAKQVQHNLEDVQYMLKRLISFRFTGPIQEMVNKSIAGVQDEVRSVYGATLRLSSSML